MFNTWMRDPEAFSSDYDEYQALLRQQAQPERDALDLVREAEEAEGEPVLEADDLQEWREPEDDMSDVEADADTLASAGMGTDEDYGDYGQCSWDEY